jgi:hypothetical protein
MIYELATAASNFIADHNTVVRFGKMTSLIEDRAKRAEEEEIIASNQAAIQEEQRARLRLEEEKKMQAEMEANEYKRLRLREQRMQADREASQSTYPETPGYTSIEKFEKPLRLPGNLLADVLVRGSVICQSKVPCHQLSCTKLIRPCSISYDRDILPCSSCSFISPWGHSALCSTSNRPQLSVLLNSTRSTQA